MPFVTGANEKSRPNSEEESDFENENIGYVSDDLARHENRIVAEHGMDLTWGTYDVQVKPEGEDGGQPSEDLDMGDGGGGAGELEKAIVHATAQNSEDAEQHIRQAVIEDVVGPLVDDSVSFSL